MSQQNLDPRAMRQVVGSFALKHEGLDVSFTPLTPESKEYLAIASHPVAGKKEKTVSGLAGARLFLESLGEDKKTA